MAEIFSKILKNPTSICGTNYTVGQSRALSALCAETSSIVRFANDSYSRTVRLEGAQIAHKQLTTLVRAVVLLLCAVVSVQASHVVYDLQFQEGPGGFALHMVFDDVVPDKEHAIMATVTLTPGRYTG